MVKVMNLMNLMNFSGAGRMRIFAVGHWRVTPRPSSQDRGDVRTAQMPLPVPLADFVCD
jgi:hypothetical protein